MPIPIELSKLRAEDILDVAAFIEHEARERYEVFAEHLEAQGEREAADFFRHMARLEAAHGAELTGRRLTRFADLPVHVRDAVGWDVEGPPLNRSRRLPSVAEAVEIGIASEGRARDFHTQALEQPVDPTAAAVLEELRADELSHIRLLEAFRLAGYPASQRNARQLDTESPYGRVCDCRDDGAFAG